MTQKLEWRPILSAPRDGTQVVLLFWTLHEAPGGPFPDYIVCEWDALEDGGWLNSGTLDFIESVPFGWLEIPAPEPFADASGAPAHQTNPSAEVPFS